MKLTTCLGSLATTGEILAVTFTNKAAKEMLTRLEGMIPYDLRRMWVGTFHDIARHRQTFDGIVFLKTMQEMNLRPKR